MNLVTFVLSALIASVCVLSDGGGEIYHKGEESAYRASYEQIEVFPEHDPEEQKAGMDRLGFSGAFYDVPLEQDFVNHVVEVCKMYGVLPEVMFGMAQQESSFRADAVSSHGAYGMWQIMPKWHADRMERLGVYDLFDEWQEIYVACDYMRELLERCDGDYTRALTRYRYGVEEILEEDYAAIVLENARRIKK